MGMLRYTRALYGAIRDNAAQSALANRDAEERIRPTYGVASSNDDAERVAAETQRIKKERGISIRNNLRKHLNMME